jgi:hypothetical protein
VIISVHVIYRYTATRDAGESGSLWVSRAPALAGIAPSTSPASLSPPLPPARLILSRMLGTKHSVIHHTSLSLVGPRKLAHHAFHHESEASQRERARAAGPRTRRFAQRLQQGWRPNGPASDSGRAAGGGAGDGAIQ